jgi:diaminopimelate decarboxylase
MNAFDRRDGALHCEGVPLAQLAERHGTPLYVYSRTAIRERYAQFREAFAGRDHLICFAAKANPSRAILETLAGLGAGADIVSGGELYRAVRAGIPAGKIVYSGVGKSVTELEEALAAGILMFNVESFSELEALGAVAARLGRRPLVSLRVNPDVDPCTHPYVATGLKTSKFGIRFESVLEGYRRAASIPGIDVAGVDCHIGSQLSSMGPFLEAVALVRELLATLRDRGFDIRYLDVGGGLGITYGDERPPSPLEYGRAIREALAGERATIVLEPGRSLVGNAGVLLTRVLYTKQAEDRRFAMVDAGMNDLLRPSLYGAFHAVEEVLPGGRDPEVTDVVGPVCESGDFLARGRIMPAVRAGDLLAVMSAGAYGASMASTYNSRPLAAEVMVDGDRHALIRERGTYADLTRGERPADLT